MKLSCWWWFHKDFTEILFLFQCVSLNRVNTELRSVHCHSADWSSFSLLIIDDDYWSVVSLRAAAELLLFRRKTYRNTNDINWSGSCSSPSPSDVWVCRSTAVLLKGTQAEELLTFLPVQLKILTENILTGWSYCAALLVLPRVILRHWLITIRWCDRWRAEDELLLPSQISLKTQTEECVWIRVTLTAENRILQWDSADAVVVLLRRLTESIQHP